MNINDYKEESKFWDRDNPSIQSDFLCRPYVYKLMGDVKGKRIADIGCGDGYVSRFVANQGASEVLGVDVKESVIEEAKKDEGRDKFGIKYFVGSALDLHMIEDESTDVVLSVLVYGHFNKEEMQKANQEASRILKDKGSLVLAVPHPFMYMARPKTKWITFVDKNNPNYFDDKTANIILHRADERGARFNQPIPVRLHTIGGYINGLLDSGFIIEEVLEPKPTPEDLNTFPDMWGEESRIPCYLIYKAQKG